MFRMQQLGIRRTLYKSQMLKYEVFLQTTILTGVLKEETLIYQENWRKVSLTSVLRWYEDYTFVPNARRTIFPC